MRTPGPWVCGMDFPFGQPRALVAALGWPEAGKATSAEICGPRRTEFEAAIRADMATKAPGQQVALQARRPQERVEQRDDALPGARRKDVLPGRAAPPGRRRPREPCRPTGDDRVAVEAYPAVVARRFLGRASYKRDAAPIRPNSRRAGEARRRAGVGVAAPSLRVHRGGRGAVEGESSSRTPPPTPWTRCCARSRRPGLTLGGTRITASRPSATRRGLDPGPSLLANGAGGGR